MACKKSTSRSTSFSSIESYVEAVACFQKQRSYDDASLGKLILAHLLATARWHSISSGEGRSTRLSFELDVEDRVRDGRWVVKLELGV